MLAVPIVSIGTTSRRTTPAGMITSKLAVPAAEMTEPNGATPAVSVRGTHRANTGEPDAETSRSVQLSLRVITEETAAFSETMVTRAFCVTAAFCIMPPSTPYEFAVAYRADILAIC